MEQYNQVYVSFSRRYNDGTTSLHTKVVLLCGYKRQRNCETECTGESWASKSQVPQDPTPSRAHLINILSIYEHTKSFPAPEPWRYPGNGMRGDRRTSYIQICICLTLTSTYKCSFQHSALQAARTDIELREITTSNPMSESREHESAWRKHLPNQDARVMDYWLRNLGRCVPARHPTSQQTRNLIHESYRNGACRRLCIRCGGRQTDETID